MNHSHHGECYSGCFLNEGDFPPILPPFCSFASPFLVSFSPLLSPDVLSYLCHVFLCTNHGPPSLINGGVYLRGHGAGVQLRAKRGRKRIPSWNCMRSSLPDTIHIQKTRKKMCINEWDYFPRASRPRKISINIVTCHAALTSIFNLFKNFFFYYKYLCS